MFPHTWAKGGVQLVRTDVFFRSIIFILIRGMNSYLLVGQGPHTVPMSSPEKVLIKPPRCIFMQI